MRMITRTQIQAPLATTHSFTSLSTHHVQRKRAFGNHASGSEDAEYAQEKGSVHRKAITSERTASSVPPIVDDVLRSPGQPLDGQSRAFFEPRFGMDFSTVRIHTDGKSAESAQAVNAQAYAVGRDIVFNSGKYVPQSSAGRQILAHELAHVVQQGTGELRSSEPHTISDPGDFAEREASRTAQQLASGAPQAVVQGRTSSGTLHRLPFGITLPTGIRSLDPVEEGILRPVFGSSLDYSAIHLSDAVGGGGRKYTAMLPLVGLVINIGPTAYSTPGSNPSLLIHESTHCWQSQHHPEPTAFMGNSIASQAGAAVAGGDAYCYIPGKPFSEYGAEQIAEQVENGEAPIISHVSSVSAGSIDLDNILSLAVPRWETRGAPGVSC
jgi:Domain of unknown function (DUF4157)